jgi:hypothetical protein
METLTSIVRTNTAASRLSHTEVVAMFRALEDNDVGLEIPPQEEMPPIDPPPIDEEGGN